MPELGPLAKRVLVALPALALGLGVGAGLIVRDCSLTCNVGYRLAPLASLAIALVAVPFVALQVRLLGARFEQFQVKSSLIAAAVLVIFRLWTWSAVMNNPYAAPGGTPVREIQAAYLSYFVVVDPLSVLLFTNLVRLAKRVGGGDCADLIGVMAGATLAGGMAGSALAGAFVPWLVAEGLRYEIARDHLLLVTAACVVLYALVARIVARRVSAAEEPPAATAGLLAVAGSILRDAHLRWTGAILFFTGLAAIVLDYVFYAAITEGVSASNGRTVWFATFYFWLNAASLVLLVFGTGRLMKRLGLAFALLALPVVVGLGAGALLVHGTLLAFCCMRVARDGVTSTLYAPATEVAMMSVAPERYALVRTVLGGLAFSFGLGAGAVWLLVATFGLGLSRGALLASLAAVAVLWTLATLAQRRAA